MSYRIGFDIGIASVGWCVYNCDENGEATRIKYLGVRAFEEAEHPQTGASLALPRREARSARRRTRRRTHRLERIKYLIESMLGCSANSLLDEHGDLFALRVRALDEPISKSDLGRILIYFCKHRGFFSNRRSESKNKETGKLLTAVNANQKLMEDKGYRTVGEMLFKDEKYFDIINGNKVYKTRNRDGDYSKSFYRLDLEKELLTILNTQKVHLNLSDEFIEKSNEIFMSQRSFDEGPGGNSPYKIDGYNVGKCTILKTEYCAPKASFSAEYAIALQKINNLTYTIDGTEYVLTDNERRILMEQAKNKEKLTFANVKKLLSLPTEATFNLLSYSEKGKAQADIEKNAKFCSMSCSYTIKNALSESNKYNTNLLDSIAEILSLHKNDDSRSAKLSQLPENLSPAEIDNLLELDFSKFGNLCLTVLRKIIPYLEEGKKYNEACSAAGYDFQSHAVTQKMKFLKGKEIQEIVQSITSPVTKRAVSQTIKVLNAIIRKEGAQPCGIIIELARDLAKTHDERAKIKKQNDERAAQNATIEHRLKELGINIIKPGMMLKYRLYEEQGGKCAYSQTPLDLTSVLVDSSYAEVDHIIPYSRSFDDSMNNKVLVLRSENQKKRNRTPFEYFGDDEARWKKYEDFVDRIYVKDKHNTKKAAILLRKSFSDDNAKEWKNRAIEDTWYITKAVFNMINDYLELEPIPGKKKQVFAVNGRITAYLRKFYGLNKVREDGDKHHALDAAVIGTVTDSIIQKMTKYNQLKERNAKWDPATKKYMFMDKDGELFDEKDFDEKHCIEVSPYEHFRTELLIRYSDNPLAEKDKCLQTLPQLGYTMEEINGLQPFFVSRMPNHKVTGPIHAETLRSMRAYESEGKSSSKTSLEKLKLTKDGEIKNYNKVAKDTDLALYNALVARLKAFGGNAEKAFAEPFYKPTKDGKQGNPVHKVWIDDVFNTGVVLEKRKLLAENGGMVRIDIFAKNGKYYTVPVYLKDIYAKNLPNKAIVANKKYADWDVIDESYEFLFSLYSRDLVYIEEKTPLKLKRVNANSTLEEPTDVCCGFFYYVSTNVSSGSLDFFNHDKSLKIEGKGIKTMPLIKKYQVDVLGNISEAPKEERPNAEWDT